MIQNIAILELSDFILPAKETAWLRVDLMVSFLSVPSTKISCLSKKKTVETQVPFDELTILFNMPDA